MAAVAFVKETTGTSLTPSVGFTSGSTLVLFIMTKRSSGGARTVSSVASAHTTGWAKLAGNSPAASYGMEVWYGRATGSATETITVTMSGATVNNALNFSEFSGVLVPTGVDGTAVTALGSSVTPATAAYSTIYGQNLILACEGHAHGTAPTASPGGDWHSLTFINSSTVIGIKGAYIDGGSIGAQSGSWTIATASWGTVLGALRAASVDTTVVISTGVQSGSSAGTVSASVAAAIAIAGLLCSAAISGVSVSGGAIAALTGAAAMSGAANTTQACTARVPVLGAEAAPGVSPLTEQAGSNIEVAGIGTASSAEDVTAEGTGGGADVYVNLVGAEVTSSYGLPTESGNATALVEGANVSLSAGLESTQASAVISFSGASLSVAASPLLQSGSAIAATIGVQAGSTAAAVIASASGTCALNGAQIGGTAGVLVLSGGAVAAASGVQAASAVNAPSTLGTAVSTVLGLQLDGTAGTVVPSGESIAAPSGLQLSSAAADVSIETVSGGSIDVSITGASLTLQAGSPTLSADSILTLAGVEFASSIGYPLVSGSAVGIAVGNQLSAVAGVVTPETGGSIHMQIIGVAAGMYVGLVVAAIVTNERDRLYTPCYTIDVSVKAVENSSVYPSRLNVKARENSSVYPSRLNVKTVGGG